MKLYTLTPQEIMDLFHAGCSQGCEESYWAGNPRPRKDAVIDIIYVWEMKNKHERGEFIPDCDEFRKTVAENFKDVNGNILPEDLTI
jgi:hypothetical protein